MNPERLLTLYNRVVDAPDAVLHLQQLVLDLAVCVESWWNRTRTMSRLRSC